MDDSVRYTVQEFLPPATAQGSWQATDVDCEGAEAGELEPGSTSGEVRLTPENPTPTPPPPRTPDPTHSPSHPGGLPDTGQTTGSLLPLATLAGTLALAGLVLLIVLRRRRTGWPSPLAAEPGRRTGGTAGRAGLPWQEWVGRGHRLD